MNIKKLPKAWSAIKIRYPIFQIFNSNKVFSIALSVSYLSLLFFSILWAYGIPQDNFSIKSITGIPDGIFTSVIEITFIIFVGVSILFLKVIRTSSVTETNRRVSSLEFSSIQNKLKWNQSLIYKLERSSRVTCKFDRNDFYSLPKIIEASNKWTEINKDEYFLVEAGSLDIPKLTIKSISFNAQAETWDITLGASSFYDIFFTHYSPDLPLSNQQIKDCGLSATLKSLYEKSITEFYKLRSENYKEKNEIDFFDLLPNPLGVSGIIIVTINEISYTLLRTRGNLEILDRGRVEWSFAGLIEATEWVHSDNIDFGELVYTELEDEVLKHLAILRSQPFEVEPLGIVLNPDCLYQPELFVKVEYCLSQDSFDALERQVQSVSGMTLCELSKLKETLSEAESTKSLCYPGVMLLEDHGLIDSE